MQSFTTQSTPVTVERLKKLTLTRIARVMQVRPPASRKRYQRRRSRALWCESATWMLVFLAGNNLDAVPALTWPLSSSPRAGPQDNAQLRVASAVRHIADRSFLEDDSFALAQLDMNPFALMRVRTLLTQVRQCAVTPVAERMEDNDLVETMKTRA